jgi:hypothetical protein
MMNPTFEILPTKKIREKSSLKTRDKKCRGEGGADDQVQRTRDGSFLRDFVGSLSQSKQTEPEVDYEGSDYVVDALATEKSVQHKNQAENSHLD